MIISINGLDNSGKTTQTNRLLRLYPDLFLTKIHINDTSHFDKQKYDYNWWFKQSSPEEFTNILYSCLKERIDYAKSIDVADKIIIMEKGLDFYNARILATLLAKGMNIYEAFSLQKDIKKSYKLEDVEEIKIYLKSGNYRRTDDLDACDEYQQYLKNNEFILKLANIPYKYIEPNEMDIVTQNIMDIIMERRCNDEKKKILYKHAV